MDLILDSNMPYEICSLVLGILYSYLPLLLSASARLHYVHKMSLILSKTKTMENSIGFCMVSTKKTNFKLYLMIYIIIY